jgi:ubiquinone biosynthesis protein COQ9
MAGKKKAAKKNTKSVKPDSSADRPADRSADSPSGRAGIIAAAMSLAALQGWRDTTLHDIADEAGLSLADMRREFSSKTAILAGFTAEMDAEMLRDLDTGLVDEAVRDRLFELIMNRLDAMQPHREGLRSILHDLVRDLPSAAMLGFGPLRCTVRWMLEGARVDSWGPFCGLQEKGLALIYLSVLRVWLNDEDPDLGKTMAALDKALGRVDEILGGLRSPGLFRRKKAAEDDAAEDEAAETAETI